MFITGTKPDFTFSPLDLVYIVITQTLFVHLLVLTKNLMNYLFWMKKVAVTCTTCYSPTHLSAIFENDYKFKHTLKVGTVILLSR